MLDCVACKEKKKQINLEYFTLFYMNFYDFTNCPAFRRHQTNFAL